MNRIYYFGDFFEKRELAVLLEFVEVVERAKALYDLEFFLAECVDIQRRLDNVEHYFLSIH